MHAYYGAPRLQSYEPPDHTTAIYRYPFFTTTTTTTTPRPRTTATTVKTTTTPRSREPTTALNEQPEQDFDTNPALAIANSFAFNRPVYVYNTFPFLPVQIITQWREIKTRMNNKNAHLSDYWEKLLLAILQIRNIKFI